MKDDDCGSVVFKQVSPVQLDRSVMLARPTSRDLVMYRDG
jgi:hypothetical protein